MTPVSARFLGALICLLGATAGLRAFALAGARGQDLCRSPESLRATSLIPGAIALGERLESLGAATFQWSEGEVANPSLPMLPLRFQIIRSYDGPSLYANPLRYGEAFGRGALPAAGERNGEARQPPRRLQPEELRVRKSRLGDLTLPLHVAWDHTEAPTGPSRLVAWFFIFDNEPVESPLLAQLRNAVSLALRGPRPLTLVMTSGVAPHAEAAAVEDAATAWLEGAWRRIADSCAAR